MKKWIIILLLAAAAGGGWWWYQRNSHAPTQYQTAPITRGEMTQVVTATGTLNPVVNVTVGSQISGNIQKLYADFNSPVQANAIVAQIDPAIYLAIVHQAEGDVANAKAALELAQLTAARKRDLAAQHAGTQADLDTATATLHQAEATVKIKEANLEKARLDLDHCAIYSPIDGVVISRSVDVGQTVAAAMNAPVLFTVANDLTKMQIDSNVAEADVGNIELDASVDFTVDAFPSRTFHGKVVQVRNAALTVQNVVTYDVVISVSNPDLKLKPGMTATVNVVIAHRDDALKIPNAALRFRPPDVQPTPAPITPAPSVPGAKPHGAGAHAEKRNRTIYMLAPGGGAPVPVPVKLGINDGITTEILEGLKEGDQVVIGATTATTGPAQASNPFGGGPPRRF